MGTCASGRSSSCHRHARNTWISRLNVTAGMLYDLGTVYQDTGDWELAIKTFQDVSRFNQNYRDVARRVKDLEAVRKNS